MDYLQNSFLEFSKYFIFFALVFLYLFRIIPILAIIAVAVSFTALFNFNLTRIVDDYAKLSMSGYQEILQGFMFSFIAAFLVISFMSGLLLFAQLSQSNFSLCELEIKHSKQINNSFKILITLILINSTYFMSSCVDLLSLSSNFNTQLFVNYKSFILPFFKNAFEIAFILMVPQYLLILIFLILTIGLKKVAPKIYEQQYLKAVLMQVVLLGITVSLSIFNQQVDDYYNHLFNNSLTSLKNSK